MNMFVCEVISHSTYILISYSLTTFSYIYTDSLPVNLKEMVARDVLEQAKAHPKLQHLSKLCSVYLEKYALKASKLCIIISIIKVYIIFLRPYISHY